jgi:hypothetical protein
VVLAGARAPPFCEDLMRCDVRHQEKGSKEKDLEMLTDEMNETQQGDLTWLSLALQCKPSVDPCLSFCLAVPPPPPS